MDNNQKKNLISVIVPVYNEESNILAFYNEVTESLEGTGYEWEIIFVNDGSEDSTGKLINGLAENNPKIKAVEFSRNFGKEIALSAGCYYVRGDAAITIDADLQHPPKLINELIKKWEQGLEVVYAARIENQGAGFFKKATSGIYWWIFKKITSMNAEPYSTDFRLLDRKVVDEFNKFTERGRIFRGIIDWMGFKRGKVEFVAPQRAGGRATYSYWKLIRLAVNSLTAFSLFPLRLAGYLGIVITFFSVVMLVIMFVTRIFDPAVFTSLAFVVMLNTLLIGIVLICLGFIALYIARIHDESVGRPLYIIRQKKNLDK